MCVCVNHLPLMPDTPEDDIFKTRTLSIMLCSFHIPNNSHFIFFIFPFSSIFFSFLLFQVLLISLHFQRGVSGSYSRISTYLNKPIVHSHLISRGQLRIKALWVYMYSIGEGIVFQSKKFLLSDFNFFIANPRF